LIGAGGNFCPVARTLGAQYGKAETLVRAQEIEFRLNETQARHCPVSPEIPELYFCPDLKGYGWIFRKGDYLNIGLGREADNGLPGHVRSFCNHLVQLGRIPEDIPGKFHGHAYILYGHADRPLCAEGLLLLGDAAGLACPESGEGIRPAIESGMIAARVILNAKGDYSGSQLQPYETAIRQRFGKPQAGDSMLFRNVADPVKQWLVQKMLGSRWFVREVVICRGFLHRNAPRLILPDLSR
jgi:flavin-dependent dehydrogenase